MLNKKTLFNTLFLLLCLSLTFWYVFRGEDLSSLLGYIYSANPWWWIAGTVLVVSFVMGESFVMRFLLRELGHEARLRRCFLYSFTGFFFCLVTPGASGGQPVQLLFMKKDGIPVHLSTLVLLIITIAYKLVLVLFDLIVIIFRPPRIMALLEGVKGWLWLGMGLTLACSALMLLLIFKPVIVKHIAMGTFHLLKKIFRTEKFASFEDKVALSMDSYGDAAFYFRTRRSMIAKVMVMTTLQRSLLFLVTWCVLMSFGISALGPLSTITLQAMVSTAVDMLPVPGGMGMSEHLSSLMLRPLAGEDLTMPAIIVIRGLTYYTQLSICACMTMVAWFRIYRRPKKELEP